MINYRVPNIEELVFKLRENGVPLLDCITTSDYGKFVSILDLEGNKVAFWSLMTVYLPQWEERLQNRCDNTTKNEKTSSICCLVKAGGKVAVEKIYCTCILSDKDFLH